MIACNKPPSFWEIYYAGINNWKEFLEEKIYRSSFSVI